MKHYDLVTSTVSEIDPVPRTRDSRKVGRAPTFAPTLPKILLNHKVNLQKFENSDR